MKNTLRAAIFSVLDRWQKSQKFEDKEKSFGSFSENDQRLAMEITNGVIRNLNTLQFVSKMLCPGRLKLNSREKMLIYMGLYQYLYLTKIPLYAIADQTVLLAKQFGRREKASFINAIFRNLPNIPFALPATEDIGDLSIRFSYTPYFIQELINAYGIEKTKDILYRQNCQVPLMMRLRQSVNIPSAAVLYNHFFQVVSDMPPQDIRKWGSDPRVYIQNVTPVSLMEKLRSHFSLEPKTILDLCAAPGGKLLLAHDFFPKAQLVANDPSKDRLKVLEENCRKYQIEPEITQKIAEEYPLDRQFDLIIVDAPCSNSGVLYKRSEARWRIDKENIDALQQEQLQILARAKDLVTKTGQIWYLTCSILPQENEEVMQQARQLGLVPVQEGYTILPNQQGYEGGFACSFRKD